MKHARACAWAIAACALLAPAPAQAYRFMTTCCGDPVHWSSDPTMKLIEVSFPEGSPQRADFEAVAGAWSDIEGSWLDWKIVNDDDDSICSECDGSEAAFFERASDWGVLGWTTLDVDNVFCSWPFCETDIEGADISFFTCDKDGTPYNWSWGPPEGAYYQRWPYVGLDQSVTGDPKTAGEEPLLFRVVVAHELGHAANLAHVSNGAARMEDREPSGGWFHQTQPDRMITPLADDADGMRELYHARASGADLYLISWQDVNTSDDPDEGVDTWPTSAAGSVLGDPLAYPANRVVRGGGRDRLQVWRGDTVDIRICMGNLGPDAVDFDSIGGLEFYLSADQTVSSTDARSSTVQLFTGILKAGQVSCGVYSFVVPYDVEVGRWYYVGTWLNRGTATGAALTNNITLNNRRLFVEQ